MSVEGTTAYADLDDVPPLVKRAVEVVRQADCRPEQGRLLYALAAGAAQVIGEAGTGCGVGLARRFPAAR